MARYRKKPVVIEAVQWTGRNWNDIHAFIGSEINHGLHAEQRQIQIETLEGDHFASAGDWIIRGVAGEVYPCNPDIFLATYELVDV